MADTREGKRKPRPDKHGRGKRSAGKIILALAGALLLPLLLNALLFATTAKAATTSTAGHASVSAPVGVAAPATPAAPEVPAAGPCDIPVIGDLGSLAGLCNTGSGAVGQLNNICSPGTPQPEQATAGLDSMIDVPGGSVTGGKTLYDNYGVAGQTWNATGLQCSDMSSLIGNNVANMTFNFAKSLDRLTITVYQSAAGNGILTWLSTSVNNLIGALGNAIYFPFLAPVVILGAIWLAWQGLIRKRATRTFEGTVWMVIACAAAIWLIGRPGDFTSIGTTVSNSVTGVMNVAFAKLPAPTDANCLPVGNNDPQSVPPNFAFTSGNGLVDQNANELWSVLVCKPWLNGEFGTTVYATAPNQQQTVVNQYGRELLWSQAIAANERPTAQLIQQKQNVYNGIASKLQATNPAVYPLFQGQQWTTRLEIGFSALFAAAAAGLLVLLIALTLIILKLGFLLLLVAGPFFLIVGTHPGFGRVIAIRWFEMLVGVLLKQIAIALTLSVLLYCYTLIMGTSDTALPWALKIMMIALVTVAVFIYRKPFQHLFSAVGYGVLGSDGAASGSLREATFGFRRATVGAVGATAGAVGAMATPPGVAGGRGARWARRFTDGATPASGEGAARDHSMAGAAAAAANGVRAPGGGGTATASGRPLSGGKAASNGGSGADGDGGSPGGSASSGSGRRQWPTSGYTGGGRAAPPLPPPGGSGGSGSGSGGAPASWARGSGARANTGPMPRARSTSSGPPAGGASGGAGSAQPAKPVPPPVRQDPSASGSAWRRTRRGK
jgi:hypothetical protein